MNRRMLIAPAVVLALGAAAIWILGNLEAAPERVWVGYKGEARHNPWFAAERLLARMDMRVRQARSIPDLKSVPADGTLVLPRRLASINRDEQVKLLQWVEGGGHLLLEAEYAGQPDPILDALGVGRRSLGTTSRLKSRSDSGKEKKSADARRKVPRYVVAKLPDAPEPMQVEIGLWRSLEAKQARLSLTDAEATWLVHIERGAGRVTAMTDLSFAGIQSIRKRDHAEFLWQVVRLAPSRTSVTFFHSPTKLSLWDWLRENAWAALSAAALLLAMWLWRIVPRFGPVAPDAEPARKRLLDHLRASGRFQWSSGGAQALAEAAREAALRKVARAHPDFTALGAHEREARLAEQFGLSPEGVRTVLQPAQNAPHATHATPGGLVAATSVYQTIHEQLSQTRGKQ
jgi:hypothetical protein